MRAIGGKRQRLLFGPSQERRSSPGCGLVEVDPIWGPGGREGISEKVKHGAMIFFKKNLAGALPIHLRREASMIQV